MILLSSSLLVHFEMLSEGGSRDKDVPLRLLLSVPIVRSFFLLTYLTLK